MTTTYGITDEYDDEYRSRPLNAELAWKVRDTIAAHPEHHDQGVFFADQRFPSCLAQEHVPVFAAADVLTRCGTVACVAGWALLLSGYTLNDRQQAFRPDGSTASWIGDEARDLLGLTKDEATRLFYEADEDEVPDVIEEIFGPRPEADC